MDQLTDDQRNTLQKWFDQKAPLIGKCPMCGQRNWSLASHMVAPAIFSLGSINLGGPTYPMVMLICGHCANVQFHSSVAMGLVPSAGESPVGEGQ